MLRRIDRILLRVPHLPAAVRFYRDTLGLQLLKEDARIASLRFPASETELILHIDPDLPAEATYYLVDNVRDLFNRRVELKLQFIQNPSPIARGYRAAIKDPFGNVLLLVDRTSDQPAPAIIEDAKSPGALFPGIHEPAVVKKDALIEAYEQIGRTADDLPYTPDFERLYMLCSAQHGDSKPSRQEVWRNLLNLRKSSKLPKLGEARSRPPAIDSPARARLLELVGDQLGKRDRLPYTDLFDKIVDEFNRTQTRPLSPHLVWRLVATLAK